MGIVQSIKCAVAGKSAADLRTDLANVESRLAAATAAWAENESETRWAAVEDARVERDKLQARLARAEQLDRDAAQKAAAEARAKEIAAYNAKKAEANKNAAFVVAKKDAVVPIAQTLVRHYAEILEHCDAHARLVRELHDEARRLGLPPPEIDKSEPCATEQIVRIIQRAVQQQHVKDGTEYTLAQRAAALVEGTFW